MSKKRLRAILAGSMARELTGEKKVILAATALAVLSTPIAIGVLAAPIIRAQSEVRPKFEVASIKPCQDPLNDLGPIHHPEGWPPIALNY
jgi:hypothetical protein